MRRKKFETLIYPFNISNYIEHNNFDNLYLWQNKFYYKKTYYEKIDKVEYGSLLHYYNKKWLCNKYISNMLSTINNRVKKIAESFPCCDNIKYSPQSRLMIGTGGESPFGNVLLMTLHQTYGFPYIPATAIKGCLRNYCEQEKPPNFDINKLLGSSENEENSKGQLVFFDIFPEEFTIEFDSLTPHNSTYYANEGKVDPSDSEKKIPLAIPCLSKESKFNIYIACTDLNTWENDKITVFECLENAFAEYGLGGKTSYGYGLS